MDLPLEFSTRFAACCWFSLLPWSSGVVGGPLVYSDKLSVPFGIRFSQVRSLSYVLWVALQQPLIPLQSYARLWLWAYLLLLYDASMSLFSLVHYKATNLCPYSISFYTQTKRIHKLDGSSNYKEFVGDWNHVKLVCMIGVAELNHSLRHAVVD
jgi:hypothetical protein